MQDYNRYDENLELPRRVKCYSNAEAIIDVASSHGLRVERVELVHWGFCVLKIFATRAAFKAAQYEWLARMIAEPQATEIEL